MNALIHQIATASASRGGSAPLEAGISKFAWFDIRMEDDQSVPDPIVSLLTHLKFDGVIVDDEQLEFIPDNLRKVLFVSGIPSTEQLERYARLNATVIVDPETIESGWFKRHRGGIGVTIGTCVNRAADRDAYRNEDLAYRHGRPCLY